jgi:hypothetical protein
MSTRRVVSESAGWEARSPSYGCVPSLLPRLVAVLARRLADASASLIPNQEVVAYGR